MSHISRPLSQGLGSESVNEHGENFGTNDTTATVTAAAAPKALELCNLLRPAADLGTHANLEMEELAGKPQRERHDSSIRDLWEGYIE